VSSTCMKVASDRPMVLSSRLGGVKEALLLIANPLELNFLQRDWRCACYDAADPVGASLLVPTEGRRANQRCAVLLTAALLSWIS
jgi:hypothetical protein